MECDILDVLFIFLTLRLLAPWLGAEPIGVERCNCILNVLFFLLDRMCDDSRRLGSTLVYLSPISCKLSKICDT